jgi:hypothetical protein
MAWDLSSFDHENGKGGRNKRTGEAWPGTAGRKQSGDTHPQQVSSCTCTHAAGGPCSSHRPGGRPVRPPIPVASINACPRWRRPRTTPPGPARHGWPDASNVWRPCMNEWPVGARRRGVDWSPRRRRCLVRFRWVELQAAGVKAKKG